MSFTQITIRNVRKDALNENKNLKKDGTFSEDEVKAKENNIIIVTYIISDKDNINKKVIYNEFPVHLKPNLKNLFNISSKVNYKNPFARYFIKKGWERLQFP